MITTARASVTTSATLLAGVGASGSFGDDHAARRVTLLPQVASGTVYLGGTDDVTTAAPSARWDLARFPTLTWDLEPGEELWAIVGAGAVAIDVLTGGR